MQLKQNSDVIKAIKEQILGQNDAKDKGKESLVEAVQPKPVGEKEVANAEVLIKEESNKSDTIELVIKEESFPAPVAS